VPMNTCSTSRTDRGPQCNQKSQSAQNICLSKKLAVKRKVRVPIVHYQVHAVLSSHHASCDTNPLRSPHRGALMNCSLRPFARTFAFFFCSFAALFLSVPACPGQSSSKINPESGDLILINGKIITVDANDSTAQALAIHDGKIAAVGTNKEIRKRSPKNARVIDLHGRTATPGLIDSHCHFDETSAIYGVELSKIIKIGEAVDLVRQKVATQKPGEWITGSGWDEGKLAESRYITAADL